MRKEGILSALAAVLLTATAAYLLSMLSTKFFYLYGYGLFIVTPLVCGAVSALIYNRKGNKQKKEAISVSLAAGCITLSGFFLMGFEGLICLVMALPVVLPLFLAGGLVGYAISRAIGRKFVSDAITLLLVAFVPFLMGFQTGNGNSGERERKVITSVVISGSLEEVWKEVIEFSPIPEPKEFLFRMGIAYPTHAEIDGAGVGAVRYCKFSTGSFVEPITHLEINRRLAFDVIEQPTPMTEVSPYVGIHPPHLDWAVRSHKGEFLLNDLGDGKVELVGSTWYHTAMEPELYWGWVSDKMIHLIHQRVLNHIRETIESGGNKAMD